MIVFAAGVCNLNGLSIPDPGNDYQLKAICNAFEVDGPHFVVHEWPEMSTVRKQTIGLRYTGNLYYAAETINALNQVIVEDEDDISVVDIETGAPPVEKYLDLSNYDPAADPTCYAGVSCML